MGRKRRTKRAATDIEKLLEDILEDLQVVYIKEFKIGTYNVDFYIPDCKLSIQSDGGYWHKYCDSCRENREVTARQRYQSLRDKACITHHRMHKRSIMRFCGCELKNEREFVKSSIKKAIESIHNGNLIYRERLLTKGEE